MIIMDLDLDEANETLYAYCIQEWVREDGVEVEVCAVTFHKITLSERCIRCLDEPRPKVVGIGWVVECVEQREHVDETRFSVNLEEVANAGSSGKVRIDLLHAFRYSCS